MRAATKAVRGHTQAARANWSAAIAVCAIRTLYTGCKLAHRRQCAVGMTIFNSPVTYSFHTWPNQTAVIYCWGHRQSSHLLFALITNTIIPLAPKFTLLLIWCKSFEISDWISIYLLIFLNWIIIFGKMKPLLNIVYNYDASLTWIRNFSEQFDHWNIHSPQQVKV